MLGYLFIMIFKLCKNVIKLYKAIWIPIVLKESRQFFVSMYYIIITTNYVMHNSILLLHYK